MAGINEEMVFAAADRLYEATGRIPSKEQIREALGGTGSYATIQRYLANWRDALTSRLSFKLDLPDVPERAVQAFRGLWLLAMEEAGNNTNDALTPLQEEVIAQKTKIAELSVALSQSQSAAEKATLDALRSIEAAEARAVASQQRASTHLQLYQEREARVRELEIRLTDLQDELKHKEQNFEAAIKLAHERAEATESRLISLLEAEKIRGESIAKKLNQDLKAAKQCLSTAEETRRSLHLEIQAKTKEVEAVKRQAHLLEETVNTQMELIKQLKSKNGTSANRRSRGSKS